MILPDRSKQYLRSDTVKDSRHGRLQKVRTGLLLTVTIVEWSRLCLHLRPFYVNWLFLWRVPRKYVHVWPVWRTWWLERHYFASLTIQLASRHNRWDPHFYEFGSNLADGESRGEGVDFFRCSLCPKNLTIFVQRQGTQLFTWTIKAQTCSRHGLALGAAFGARRPLIEGQDWIVILTVSLVPLHAEIASRPLISHQWWGSQLTALGDFIRTELNRLCPCKNWLWLLTKCCCRYVTRVLALSIDSRRDLHQIWKFLVCRFLFRAVFFDMKVLCGWYKRRIGLGCRTAGALMDCFAWTDHAVDRKLKPTFGEPSSMEQRAKRGNPSTLLRWKLRASGTLFCWNRDWNWVLGRSLPGV